MAIESGDDKGKTSNMQAIKRYNTIYSACGSSIFTTITVHPLDVIKTTLQKRRISNINKKVKSCSIYNSEYYKITKEICKSKKGVFELYRGLNFALLRAVPGLSYYLTALNYISPKTRELTNLPKSISDFITSTTIRGSAAIIFLPISLQKIRREGGLKKNFKIKTILKQYKISTLPSIVKDSLFSGCYFMIYTYFKDIYTQQLSTYQNQNLPKDIPVFLLYLKLLVPIVASTLATIITQPIDVIVSQRQLSDRKITFKELFKNRNLFAGLMPRLFRRGVSASLLWNSFEYFK